MTTYVNAQWTPCDEQAYTDALEVLPPVDWRSLNGLGDGFLLGEPFDHGLCSVTNELRARYTAYIHYGSGYWYSGLALTRPEWRAVKLPNSVAVKCV